MLRPAARQIWNPESPGSATFQRVSGALQSLLVTDIVGSTRLWAEQEAAMEADLVTHDELVLGAIAAAQGRMFKHTGDGMMATFESAAASARAAAAIQRAIAEAGWRVTDRIRVRIALHSGGVHQRDGDLFGPSVNRLARLLSHCPPGGVLVSEATAALLADSMPDGLALRELGPIELRDVGRTEIVHCLEGAGITEIDADAVLGTAAHRVGSLPLPDAELVGRTAEIAAVLDALDAHSIVSIVGVGGMGKTRLALEAASTAGFADGAWWCDLAAATTPDAVPATVLNALGAHQTPGRAALDTVVDHLATQRAVVVLDNCEHVVDAARDVAAAIRAGCPKVAILATSREALGLRGEHVVPLSALPGDDASGLFCSRAAEARPDLVFDDATLASIDEICTRLDGIPLAIELAAARCRAMTPAEIAARLDDRFRLLRGGRGGVERHRTLLAAVEWSYSLLEDDERAIFDQMSVFAGGALIDAIAEVCEVDEYDALDVLDRLIARSMVVAADTELGTRYRQLETLRQYAEERLVESGEIDQVRGRHLAWAANPTYPHATAEGTTREADGFRRFVAEIDNLRAAAAYAVSANREAEACRVIAGFGGWAALRPTFEVLDWVDPTTIEAEAWDETVARAVGALGMAAIFGGEPASAVELLAAVPDAWQEHFQMLNTKVHADRPGDTAFAAESLRHTGATVDRARAAGAQISLVIALIVHGYCLEGSGNPAAAIPVQTEALELADSLGVGAMVDAARVGLVESMTQVAASGDGEIVTVATATRAGLELALARRSVFFALIFLGGAVERLLWIRGEQHAATIVSRFARRNMSNWASASIIDTDSMSDAELAAIDAEAAALDLDGAGAIAIAALDRVIAASTPS